MKSLVGRLAAALLGGGVMMLALPAAALAQNGQAGLHLLAGIPQGEFADNVDQPGWGLSGQIGYAPQTNPYFVGLEVGYLVYGDKSRFVPFSSTIPDVIVEVNTTNNILTAHALLRLQSNVGTLRPYGEGVFGLNYLFTRTTIRNSDFFTAEVAGTTNQDDVALSYGGGGGVMLRVHESSKLGRTREVLLDLRLRYLVGGEADYLNEASLRREDGGIGYAVKRSKTDLFTIQVGAVFRF
ncbi:MAG: outer membrane beta-barrel protein [candidate division KSB1 bacterium]|nr:outer membrane beta-barrel protein [candidate division KSB1 bacterium]MDZ7273451.1 outer membrane beta-barrel protein [candidate division KSB1 bacterium]MDZ7286957.1 outer membrane beta-barrel protein [candidate division KSB1 bacterium]MDZ7299690.1 outer membrane beta-barrel protein [candidate division KSB1 bacterium]MDZ7307954.1 outer membrane beta-barrel protein [candidate division KSB1 bacterium]